MSDFDFDYLTELGLTDKNFKWVQSDDPNAADRSMIDAMRSLLRKGELGQFVVITGDGDFYGILDDAYDYHVVVISQFNNFNSILREVADEVHFVHEVATIPQSWFY